MKKLTILSILAISFCAPAIAVPTVEFAGASSSAASGWSFNATTDTFTFGASPILAVYGGIVDTAVGEYVHIPDMTLGGSSGAWTLSGGTIIIADATASTIYLTGTLASGNLAPSGTTADSYTLANADITWTSINNTISSDAIDDLMAAVYADFDLTFTAGASVPGGSFEAMLTGSTNFGDGLVGTITIIPAPGAVLLGGIGVALVGWLRRRRTL